MREASKPKIGESLKMSPYTVNITDENGNVVNSDVVFRRDFVEDGVSGMVIIFQKPVQQEPLRSPLHTEALNMNDLKKGMFIRLHQKDIDHIFPKALVLSEPFRHGDKHGYGRHRRDNHWMISVQILERDGEFIRREWFLSDVGVIPYEREGVGSPERWHERNYVLAAD